MKLLFIGVRMDMGGTEKALLSLLEALDPSTFHVSLLLAEHKGPLMDQIPQHVTLLPPITNGALFGISRRNAWSVIKRIRFRKKGRFICQHARLLSEALRGRDGASERYFIAWMRRACPLFAEEHPDMTFDAAVAFSGDRTMFYLCEKIRCERKIAFLHFDFHHPRRDHAVYDEYFRRCDAVLSVSESCTSLLKREFPNLSNRFMTFYNVLPTRKIWILSMSGISLPPSNGEYRVLSVMRLCHQKGVDRIPIIIRMLTDRGVSVRWYIIGGGSERDIRRLRASAHRYCVSDRLILLGTVEEPYTMMRECDLFVLPSRFEGMPIVVEEAKLFAVPILCTDYLSAYEQLDNGRLGKIVAQTPSAIADGIASLLTSPVQMNRYRAELLSEPSKSRNVTLEWRKILDCE